MNVALLRPLPLRLASAVLILGAALAGAAFPWGYRVLGAEHSCPAQIGTYHPGAQYDCYLHPRPNWVYPAGLGVVLIGFVGAASVLIRTRRRDA